MVFFDTPNERRSTEYPVLPVGHYHMQIKNSELKATKSGSGTILVVHFEVIAGEHKGQKLRANYNINNSSKKAEEIGRSEFASLLDAVGVTEPLASFDAAGAALQGKVIFGETENEIYQDKIYSKLKKALPSDHQPPVTPKAEELEVPF